MVWPFKRKKWEELGKISNSTQIEERLSDLGPEHILTKDSLYRQIPQKDFEKLLFDNWFPKDGPGYKKEKWDCDDIANDCLNSIRRAWANKSKGEEALAVGYVEGILDNGGSHAFIFFVDDKDNVLFYEPSTGQRITPSKIKIEVMQI